jgi:hypothetical protein
MLRLVAQPAAPDVEKQSADYADYTDFFGILSMTVALPAFSGADIRFADPLVSRNGGVLDPIVSLESA